MNTEHTSTASKGRPHPAAFAYVTFLQRFRWLICVLCAVLTVLSFGAMKHLVFENSNESFFREDDPTIKSLERFRNLFGNEDTVAVAVEFDELFQYDTLVRMKELSEALDKAVPYVWRTSWVGNAEYLSGSNDEINADPLAEDIPESAEEIAEFRQKALSYRDFEKSLINDDGTVAVISLEFDPYPDGIEDPRKDITPAVCEVLQRPEFAGLKTHIVGPPVQDYVSDEISARECLELGLICVVLQSFLLFYFGRGGRAVLAPIVTIVLSIIFIMGIIGAMGWPLSMMTIMLPCMLLSVCIGDCVHIISDYHRHRDLGKPHFEAMAGAVQDCWSPCLCTSLTTMLGFASFLTTDIVPIRMAGLYSALGVGLAFLLAITITPVIYMIRAEKKVARQRGRHTDAWVAAGLEKCARFSIERPLCVLAFFCAIALAGIAVWPSLPVETNYIMDLSKRVPLRQDSDFFDARMGGSMSLDIMVDSGREDGARQLPFLKDMEKLQEFIESHPLCTRTHSVADTIKRINEVLHNGDVSYWRLPDNDAQVSQCLFFYETSGGRNMDKELSFLSDVARIHVKTKTMSTSDVKVFMRELDEFNAAELGGRLKLECTGQMAWMAALSDYVVQGQVSSLLAAALSICVMMIVFLRSFKMGLISMLPNMAPIIVPFFFMWAANVNISIVLMVFSSVIIGICVDDTTHFYINYKRLMAVHGNTREAIYRTMRHVGQPVTYTTVSLMTGFGIFAVSDVRTTVEFGLLAGSAFLLGWLADVTLSPALLTLFKPIPEKKTPDDTVSGTTKL